MNSVQKRARVRPPSLNEVQVKLAEKSMRHFTRQAWDKVENRAFIPGWHIDAISDHLDAVQNGQIKKLIINVPPRHSKSLQVAVMWPAKIWTTDPGCQFIYGSHDQHLATRDSLKTRRLITTDWYLERWGDKVELQSDNSLKQSFELTSNGSRRAVSVGAGITGSGADILVCDDPHNVLQSLASDTARNEAIDWWQNTMSSRLNPEPSLQARVIIMQRIHENDLSGYLLENDPDYEILCLPAEWEAGHPIITKTSLKFVDPRTTPGEVLWPAGFSKERVISLTKDLGTYSAAGQLQQRPAPVGGGLIKGAWFKKLPKLLWPTEFDETTIYVDLSITGTENADATAIAVMSRKGTNVYLRVLINRPMGFKTQIATLTSINKLFPGVGIKIENAANAQAVLETLREHIPGIVLVNATKSKVDRVIAWSVYAEAGNCFLPEEETWVADFIAQCEMFPNGKNDDMVDAFGMGVLDLMNHASFVVDDTNFAVDSNPAWRI